jgi:hypothetical protein
MEASYWKILPSSPPIIMLHKFHRSFQITALTKLTLQSSFSSWYLLNKYIKFISLWDQKVHHHVHKPYNWTLFPLNSIQCNWHHHKYSGKIYFNIITPLMLCRFIIIIYYSNITYTPLHLSNHLCILYNHMKSVLPELPYTVHASNPCAWLSVPTTARSRVSIFLCF